VRRKVIVEAEDAIRALCVALDVPYESVVGAPRVQPRIIKAKRQAAIRLFRALDPSLDLKAVAGAFGCCYHTVLRSIGTDTSRNPTLDRFPLDDVFA
jgi:hypothetical protein